MTDDIDREKHQLMLDRLFSRRKRVLQEFSEQKKRDTERKISPLVRAKDAVLVDNTAMDAEETARLIVQLAHEREIQLSKSAGGKL